MTLQLYDCSSADPRSLYLSGEATSVDYNAVGFSYPAGTIRLKGTYKFTHFKASDMQDGTAIYRVLRRRCIAGDLIEYDYEVDYIKDYWLRFGSFGINHVSRSTDINYWLKLAIDNLQLTGDYTVLDPIQGLQFDHDNASVIIVLNGDPTRPFIDGEATILNVYNLSFTGYAELVGELNRSDIGISEAFSAAIQSIYIIPISLFTTSLEIIPRTDIKFPMGGSGQVSMQSIPISFGNCATLKQTGSLVDIGITTGLTISYEKYTDLQPYTDYQIYVPYIGQFRIDPKKSGGTLICHYIFNLIEGSVKAYITGNKNDMSSMSAPVQLPSISLMFTQSNTAMYKAVLSGITGLISSGFTNPMGVVGSVVGSVAGFADAFIRNSTATPSYTKYADYNGLTDQTFRLYKIIYDTAESAEDYGLLHGYKTEKNWSDIVITSGTKYWLDSNSLVLFGDPWYVNALKAELSNDYILYNPPTT